LSTGGQSCDQTECFLINSVWEYFVPNPASALPFGAGCAGSLGVLALRGTSLPWLGSELVLDLTPVAAAPAVAFGVAGASNTQLGSTPLPLSLAPLGLPACSLLTSSEVVVPLVAAQAHASWEVPLPAVPALIGQSVYFQGLVLGDPAGSLTTSNGVQAVLAEK
jgi:hypothetical protein